MGRNETDRMVEAQKRLIRAKMGFEDYRAAQRAWVRARAAQRRAWERKAREAQTAEYVAESQGW